MSPVESIAPEVLVDIDAGILVVTINRPHVRNAINASVAQKIAAAMDLLDQRDDLRIGVLTGAGGVFSSGMDLKAFLRGEVVKIPGRGFAGLTEGPPAKPLIAAVEGFALAGGFELALACDLIVASRLATFGLPEAKRGLVANAGGLVRLPRQLPRRIALELVLTGEPMSAERAAGFGLINYMVEPGAALNSAVELARKVAANGPLAVSASKRVMNESQDWLSAELFERQSKLTAPVFASADAREGATAFTEKRAPIWRGV
jgi:enoyl-CoA hydratase